MKKPLLLSCFVVATLALTLILRWQPIQEKILLNRLALLAIAQPGGDPTALPTEGDLPPATALLNCRIYWFLGSIQESLENVEARNRYWAEAARCDANLIVFMHSLYPEDLGLAQLVNQAQPQGAEGWFWLGDLVPEKTLDYYQRGLELNPRDGRRWLVVGGILRESDPQAALYAYRQACFNGDPGAHGCMGAGGLAEEFGDLETAIYYYRRSKFGPALGRADALEQQLLQQSTP